MFNGTTCTNCHPHVLEPQSAVPVEKFSGLVYETMRHASEKRICMPSLIYSSPSLL